MPTLFLSFEEKNKMMNWRVQMVKIVSMALLESYIFSEIPAPGVAVNEIWGVPFSRWLSCQYCLPFSR